MGKRLSEKEKICVLQNCKIKSFGLLGQELRRSKQALQQFIKKWEKITTISIRKPDGRKAKIEVKTIKMLEIFLIKKNLELQKES